MWRQLRSILARVRSGRETSVRAPSPGRNTRIRMVALVSNDCDRQLLARMAPENGWVVHFPGSCVEAWHLLKQEKPPILLFDRDFPGTQWREVIQEMSSGPDLVYSVLLSRVADDYLWNEVIRHGGYDVLATPLKETEVLRAVRLGWSYLSSSTRLPSLLPKGGL